MLVISFCCTRVSMKNSIGKLKLTFSELHNSLCCTTEQLSTAKNKHKAKRKSNTCNK